MSSNLINVDGEDGPFTSPAEIVMVPPIGRIDKIFDNKMGKLIAEREKASDALDQMQRFSKDDETNASLVQNFLNEGLDLKTVCYTITHARSCCSLRLLFRLYLCIYICICAFIISFISLSNNLFLDLY